MVLAVLGLTLDSAKTFATIGAVLLIVGAFLAAWAVKTLAQKVIVFALLAALAFAVWTQREALTDCAEKVQANFRLSDEPVDATDNECSFFGFTVTVPAPSAD